MAAFHLTHYAKRSLAATGRYTEATWGKAQCAHYISALDRRFHILAASPHHGVTRPELREDLRCWHEGKHIIFYLVKSDNIIIVDVLHQSMELPKHLRQEH